MCASSIISLRSPSIYDTLAVINLKHPIITSEESCYITTVNTLLEFNWVIASPYLACTCSTKDDIG